MNLNQLEYLIATVHHGSFAGAARELFISPQAISRAVSALERELKVDLFVKCGRGIEPTPYALLLAAKAVEVVQGYEDLKCFAGTLAHAGDGRIAGSLKLAVTSSPYEGEVVPKALLQEFAEQHPGIILDISMSISGACLSALQDGVVDASIIFGRCRIDGHRCCKLFDAELQVAMSINHPMARMQEIPLFDLQNFPIAKPHDLRYCLPVISDHFTRRDCAPTFSEIPPLPHEYGKFFDRDAGVLFVSGDDPLKQMGSSVVFRPLIPEDAIRIPICLAYKAKKSLTMLLHRHIDAKLNGANA